MSSSTLLPLPPSPPLFKSLSSSPSSTFNSSFSSALVRKGVSRKLPLVSLNSRRIYRTLVDFHETKATNTAAANSSSSNSRSLFKALDLGDLFCVYFIVNIYFKIYSKRVLKVYPVPVTLTAVRFAIDTLRVALMWGHNLLYKRPKLTSSQLLAIFPLALAHTLGNLFTNMSLGKVTVTFTHTVKSMEPFIYVLVSSMLLRKIVYGRVPPSPPTNIAGSTHIQAVREELHELLGNICTFQNTMEHNADIKRQPQPFKIGDMVLVKLKPYRQNSMEGRHVHKLPIRFYGPYKIIDKIGEVAFKLELQSNSQIHPVFHTSKLKAYRGNSQQSLAALPPQSNGNQPQIQPLAVLNWKLNADGQPPYVLIQWQGLYPEDATWEDYMDLKKTYPSFHLDDKVIFDQQRNVMTSNRGRRPKRIKMNVMEQMGFPEEIAEDIIEKSNPKLRVKEKSNPKLRVKRRNIVRPKEPKKRKGERKK